MATISSAASKAPASSAAPRRSRHNTNGNNTAYLEVDEDGNYMNGAPSDNGNGAPSYVDDNYTSSTKSTAKKKSKGGGINSAMGSILSAASKPPPPASPASLDRSNRGSRSKKSSFSYTDVGEEGNTHAPSDDDDDDYTASTKPSAKKKSRSSKSTSSTKTTAKKKKNDYGLYSDDEESEHINELSAYSLKSSAIGFKSLGNDTNGTPKVIYPSFQPTKKDCVKLSDECNKLSSIQRSEKGQLAQNNGICRPAEEYGGKPDNRQHQVLHRLCVREQYGLGINPRELSAEQKHESSLRFNVEDEYESTVTCNGCNTVFKVYKMKCLQQHNCRGVKEDVRRCQHCNKTAEELGLNFDDSHKKGKHVNQQISLHEKRCPSNPKMEKSWNDLIAFLKKQGPPTKFGKFPFPAVQPWYNKLKAAVGKVKSLRANGTRHQMPVEGDKRAQLEELGYTVENGFLYE